MKHALLFRTALAASIAVGAFAVYALTVADYPLAGPLGILFFLLLAGAFYFRESLRGYIFPTLIFAGVTLALSFPGYFQRIGDFQLTELIIPLIQVIMFGMGTAMSLKDFAAVIRTPKGVLVGVSAQLAIMPLVGFGLAAFSDLPPEIAAGIVLIGCSPSGVASNVMAYLAKANLALSITITSIATLLAPFVTPLLMKYLAGEYVAIDVLAMMWSITKMILLPIAAGLLFNKLRGSRAQWLDRALPLVSMAAIGLIIVVITAAGRDSLLDIGGWLMVLVLAHNLIGYTLGYWYARLLGMDEKDARTISLEVGMQNGGLASGIANSLGRIATMGLAPAVFGPLMNITGSVLASHWHKRPPIEHGGARPRRQDGDTPISKAPGTT